MFPFIDLVEAYVDCRRTKRNTASALEFELNLERNLRELYDELISGSYRLGRSICFINMRPKPREVWASAFRDRVVHHLLYRKIGPIFECAFIADSCACIKKRGTLFAAERLEHKIRSITQNWKVKAFYLKMDIANFFVSINKPILLQLLLAKIHEPFWRWLTGVVLMHDPRTDYEFHGNPRLLALVPPHKRLMEQAPDLGLPIGNLSSQFFANVYLNVLDQHVKHVIRAKRYIRYVDDFIILHESREWIEQAHADIASFLPEALAVRLNESKTIKQPIARGVDFVGFEIKPWRRTTRKRTRNEAYRRVETAPEDGFFERVNSYFGLLRQSPASHGDRARLANIVLAHGHAVDRDLTKTYRGQSR